MVNDSRLILKGVSLRVISVDGRIWASELASDLSLQNLKVQAIRTFYSSEYFSGIVPITLSSTTDSGTAPLCSDLDALSTPADAFSRPLFSFSGATKPGSSGFCGNSTSSTPLSDADAEKIANCYSLVLLPAFGTNPTKDARIVSSAALSTLSKSSALGLSHTAPTALNEVRVLECEPDLPPLPPRLDRSSRSSSHQSTPNLHTDTTLSAKRSLAEAGLADGDEILLVPNRKAWLQYADHPKKFEREHPVAALRSSSPPAAAAVTSSASPVSKKQPMRLRLSGSRSVAVSTPGGNSASVADAAAQAIFEPPAASDAPLLQTPSAIAASASPSPAGGANAIMTRSRTRAVGAAVVDAERPTAASETFSLSASIVTPPHPAPSASSATPTPGTTPSSSTANSSSGSSSASASGSTPAGLPGALPQSQLHYTRRRALLSALADRAAVGTSARWAMVDNATDTRTDNDTFDRFVAQNTPGARRLGALGFASASSNASPASAGATRTRDRPRGPSGRMNPVPWNDEFIVPLLGSAASGAPGAGGAPMGSAAGHWMQLNGRTPSAGWEELMAGMEPAGADAADRDAEDVDQSAINAATAHLAKPKNAKAAKDAAANSAGVAKEKEPQKASAMETDSPASRAGNRSSDEERDEAEAEEGDAQEHSAAFRQALSLLADSDTDEEDRDDQDELLELAELGIQPNFANDIRSIGMSLLDFISRLMAYDPNAHKFYAQVEEYLRERAEVAVAVDRGKAKQLVEMGFPELRARAALVANNGSIQRAMDWLLEHSGDDECEAPDCKAESGSAGSAGVDKLLPHPSQSPSAMASLSGGGCSSSAPRERHPSVDYPFNLVRLFHKYHPPAASPEHKTNEEVLSRLIAMGFQEADVRAVLEATDNNPNSALEWLLDDSKRAAAIARAAAGNKASSSDPSLGLSPTSSLHRAIFSNPSIILGLCNPRALITVLQMLEQPESQVPWLLNDGVDLHSWVHTLSQVYHAERHAVPLSERRIPVDHRGRPLRTVRH